MSASASASVGCACLTKAHPWSRRAICWSAKTTFTRSPAAICSRSFAPHLRYRALGFGAPSAAWAQEPIVGLWEITATGSGSSAGFADNVFTGWTSDGLEFDQDIVAPTIAGYVCYGHWIKLKGRTYGLTHPFYDYDATTGV